MADNAEKEKILVCISASPSNARIIRTAAQIAESCGGTLIALYVESPRDTMITDADSRRLEANMQLAARLGARNETVYGEDVPLRIAEYARLVEASRIVIGQSVQQPGRRLFQRSLTDQLAAYVPELTLMIIPDVTVKVRYHNRINPDQKKKTAADILWSLFLLSAASACGMLFQKMGVQEANIITLYILAVTLASVVSGSWLVGALNAVASVVIFNFLFTEPYFYFHVYDAGYMVTFVVMFIAAFVTGTLASRLKEYAEQSAKKAYRTQVLLDASQLLQQVSGEENILRVAGEQICKLTGRDILVFPVTGDRLGEPAVLQKDEGVLRENSGKAVITSLPREIPGNVSDVLHQEISGKAQAVSQSQAVSDKAPAALQPREDSGRSREVSLSKKDRQSANWALRNRKEAGAWTEHYSDASYLFIPARIHENTCGIFAIGRGEKELNSFVHSVIVSILAECALAVENDRNERAKEEAAVAARNEQLRSDLLRTVSHDLRTPLTSISGNAANLITSSAEMSEETKEHIYQDIREDSEWLINVVENLLAVTRLENGQVRLNRSVELINDVIEEALLHVDRDLEKHTLVRNLSDQYLFAEMDVRLIAQVIINLVNNAVKYTQEGSLITVSTWPEGKDVVVSVRDNGPGVSPETLERLFEMFYTGNLKVADSRRGLGLGLSLCRSIVEAHGGEIQAFPSQPSGLEVRFRLPGKEIDLNGFA